MGLGRRNRGAGCSLSLILVLILVFQCSCERLFSKQTPKGPPFESLEKARFLSGDFKTFPGTEKILIVNFWASWCAPCQEETPSLLRLAHRYKDQVVLLSINTEKSEKDAKKFVGLFPNFKSPNVLVLFDEDKTWSEQLGVTGVPETFIFDKNKKLIKKFMGAVDFNQDEFRKIIVELIATPVQRDQEK